tara:strand:- start:207 stop:929 length:723 start_codon:yes stop_codon:yes gene_type:complete
MIYRWFSNLFHNWASNSGERSTFSELLFRLYASANATYEGILDRGQGGTPQKVKGHDHVSYSGIPSGQGGSPLARSTAYTAGRGQVSLFRSAVNTGGAWTIADSSSAYPIKRSGSVSLFQVYFSAGFQPLTTATATAFVDCGVYLPAGGVCFYDARIHNVTTGTYSPVVSKSITLSALDPYGLIQFEIEGVPFLFGWNELNLEFSTPALVNQPDIYTNFFNIGEWNDAKETNLFSDGINL